MSRHPVPASRGLELLLDAVRDALSGTLDLAHPVLADGPLWTTAPEIEPPPTGSAAPGPASPGPRRAGGRRTPSYAGRAPSPRRERSDGPDQAPPEDPESTRMAALVDLARAGDVEAFGLLYDHYQPVVYRFLYHRTSSVQAAEDLTSETFFRALRGLGGFRWQGRDFGAWLTTIARNLLLDQAKSGRARFERVSDDLNDFETATEGPETEVLAAVTGALLRDALDRLAPEQRECLVLRFIEGCSIAETAAVLRRSEGAVKQLQLRAVRNLAAMMPDGIR